MEHAHYIDICESFFYKQPGKMEPAPVVCYMKGRFGNQLFQYWISRLIADKLQRPLHLHICTDNPFMLTWLPNIRYDLLANGWVASHVPDKPHNFDLVAWATDEFETSPHVPVCVNAYAESYELVSKYEDIIREYYSNPRFIDTPDEEISIHIRLGDLAHVNAGVHDYLDYCVETVKTIKDKDPNVGITIVSEEPRHSYTKKLSDMLESIGNVKIMPAASIEDDFVTLRNSKYIIMQNSTFSWWAGFLANKDKTRVYAYASHQLGCGARNDDLFRLSPSNFDVKMI